MRTLALATAAFLVFIIPTPSRAQISREQARSLVHTTLRLRGDKVPTRQIHESTETIPGYYSFGAYHSPQGNMQDIVGWFAVNKRTGQVWDTTSCDLYEFPTLERQRRKLVRHAKKSHAKPPCAEGQRAHIIRKRTSRHAAELPEVAQ
ncbi:MAG: hypothetical protein ROO76_10745 [Terriglobia bacterium]|jgi:hypothetical protein|nr:hypothetical protein [Terriglobia bacterium]